MRAYVLGALLVAVGLAGIAAEVARIPILERATSIGSASPVPRLFVAQNGVETYAIRTELEFDDGKVRVLGPGTFGRYEGPETARAVLHGALRQAPALWGDRALRRAIEEVAHTLREEKVKRIRFEPQPGADPGFLPRTIEVPK